MSKLIATITSQFGARGYSGLPVSRISAYAVDSAMDTDSDQWSIDVGDPANQLVNLLRRDSEVRVALALNAHGQLVPILQGYADSIGFTHDGRLALQGRDLSAAAVDDTAPPFNWHNARPEKIIRDMAGKRGFTKFNIPKVGQIPNLFTDGSESVWAFWYRMIRKKQMWIWVDANGMLNVDHLNYAANPSYFFGEPNGAHPDPHSWIRVQQAEIRKNTQTRVYEVWVFGDSGSDSFFVKDNDALITDWIKKPLKIITADAAHTNRAQALKEVREEIFEGIVGSIEITLRVSDPGFIIRQNRTAFVNLPTMDYSGEFFVVGSRMIGGSGGLLQEVRLREKNYALTRRIPKDPVLKDDTTTNVSASDLGSHLGLAHADWGQYFVIAAQDWHGGWPFDLFLATLLAICSHESTFTNVREGGSGTEWTEPPSSATNREAVTQQAQHGMTLQEWKKHFANTAGNPLNPYGREAGVGPMQLTDAAAKHKADARMKLYDEYTGGRWHPSANIWVGAEWLANKLQGLPQTEANFWIGVKHYNGSGPAADAYAAHIKEAVKTQYLPSIQTQLKNRANILPANSTKTAIPLGAKVPTEVRKIINFCERQRGKPYVSGASGPDSYDCSGLAYAAYKAAGLGTQIGGRQTTWGYWANGKGYGNLEFVPVDNLMPGDMVFFDVPTDGGQPPQHMGIYYHDNQMIAAPSPGHVVYAEGISAPGVWTCMGGMRMKGLWKISKADPNYDPHHMAARGF